jgi:hypothetical protein
MSSITPLFPSIASPVLNKMEPLPPSLLVPVLKTKSPLIPTIPEFAVSTFKVPLEDGTP